uniref:N-acetylgalactosaminide beta-1,3-galactosyltransferase n=1 Tax=Plectus sambesii TaxID=2011161 RepID=A0A914VYQ9_9BILA
MTSKRNHKNRAAVVDETWPKRCDKYEFFTDDGNTTFPSADIFYNMTDGHIKLWPKTKVALQYIYDTYLDDFDWFLKADDDTYIVVENLKLMLARLDSSLPHYLGFRLKPYIDDGYNSGGAGYVLSRSALVAFVEKALTNKSACQDGWAEDLQLAYCLKNVGVLPGDTRDSSGRNTFFPYHPNHHMNGIVPNGGHSKFWYYYPMEKGFDAFSEHFISMHHLSPTEMRLIDLLLYRIRVPSA